jgi:hypothetical protein
VKWSPAALSFLRHEETIPMFDFENHVRRGDPPPRRLIGMGIPRQFALQQSLPPLFQPQPFCNHTSSSVEQFSANGMCLTDCVSQNRPQSSRRSGAVKRTARYTDGAQSHFRSDPLRDST